MGVKLSILDQSPVFEGDTAAIAFQNTIELVQLAEALGYHRFWVSEHHDSDQVAGSSPEVLISYLLARTQSIRIGSGGIMLQHYSPYKVAENFNVLATLAPGRVDLGVGRAPGGLPRSTKALQQGVTEIPSLEHKLEELEQLIHNQLDSDHPQSGLRATPNPVQPAELYLLGASVSSAESAADLGLPYVFAQFINSDPMIAENAFAAYRNRFNTSKGTEPQLILALSVIIANTDEEANELAGEQKLIKVHLDSGKSVTLGTIEKAEEFGNQSNEGYRIDIQDAAIAKGSKETVRQHLLNLQQHYGIEEFVVTTAIKDFSKRIHSYKLLKEAFSEVLVEGE
ncbi:alkane 1-monooxygenase [Paenibacillus macquariensis subsp. defensor]|nr:alkane 1-monooxygenase [Paenibacillus macquariensis subsp. defensor]